MVDYLGRYGRDIDVLVRADDIRAVGWIKYLAAGSTSVGAVVNDFIRIIAEQTKFSFVPRLSTARLAVLAPSLLVHRWR